MAIVKFTGTVLPKIGKKGILTPDDNGYYTMVVGGLNCFNSVGEYYVAQGVTELFENSSHLMRRINNGSLFGEVGHPVKPKSMSMEDFYTRVLSIDQKNICCHFSEVWLDFDYGKNNPEANNKDLIAIMAKIKPSGIYGPALEESFKNGKENVAFSIRGITENKFNNGRVERTLTQIVTWDKVVEPGIKIANKWNSPVLEELSTMSMSIDTLIAVAKTQQQNEYATESDRELYTEIIEKFAIRTNPNKVFNW